MTDAKKAPQNDTKGADTIAQKPATSEEKVDDAQPVEHTTPATTQDVSDVPALGATEKTGNTAEDTGKLSSKQDGEVVPQNQYGEIVPGMTIRLYQRIKEKNTKGEEKERVQYFEGMVLARKHGREFGATIRVRKVSNGVGVEKVFPLNLPTITKIEILKKMKRVRRSKLYYLRHGYKKRLKEEKLD
ncbi:MAG TPA: 50S ribosomal protein L19 [Patescibacteria group bacterium]|nr:50S ribosomal protein L19 [Patescibacteria group bacterium]